MHALSDVMDTHIQKQLGNSCDTSLIIKIPILKVIALKSLQLLKFTSKSPYFIFVMCLYSEGLGRKCCQETLNTEMGVR